MAVVVPAADEQDTIADCLDAILRAKREYSHPVEIVVVADSCRDATCSIVRTYPEVTLLHTDRRCVGDTRRVGAEHALRRLCDDDLVASTDADTIVPVDWFVRAAALMPAVDLLLGTVLPAAGLEPGVEAAWYAAHDLRDGHAYVHGANLFCRVGAYRQLGGWHALHTGEDVEFALRAVAADLQVRATAALPVRTSTRPDGRAPLGFSSYLRDLRSSTQPALRPSRPRPAVRNQPPVRPRPTVRDQEDETAAIATVQPS